VGAVRPVGADVLADHALGGAAEPGGGDERHGGDPGADGVGGQPGGAANGGDDADDSDAGRLPGELLAGDGRAHVDQLAEVGRREPQVRPRQRQRIAAAGGQQQRGAEPDRVAGAARQRRPLDAVGGNRPVTQDEERVEDDVGGDRRDVDGQRRPGVAPADEAALEGVAAGRQREERADDEQVRRRQRGDLGAGAEQPDEGVADGDDGAEQREPPRTVNASPLKAIRRAPASSSAPTRWATRTWVPTVPVATTPNMIARSGKFRPTAATADSPTRPSQKVSTSWLRTWTRFWTSSGSASATSVGAIGPSVTSSGVTPDLPIQPEVFGRIQRPFDE
jgi:hypothetical protein